jgi:hypothetical protein
MPIRKPQLAEPLLPGGVVDRVGRHRPQAAVVPQAIAAEALELVHEHRRGDRRLGPVFGFAPENLDGDPHVEPAPFRFGLLHDVRLKRREIMREAGHRPRHDARVLKLSQQEIERHGEPRRREDLLLHQADQLLNRHVLGKPFAERAKEVSLFDVFFAVEHGGRGECWWLVLVARGKGESSRFKVGFQVSGAKLRRPLIRLPLSAIGFPLSSYHCAESHTAAAARGPFVPSGLSAIMLA